MRRARHLLLAFGRLSQGVPPPCRLWYQRQGPICQFVFPGGASRATGTATTRSRARAGAARISTTPKAHSPRLRSANERTRTARSLRPHHPVRAHQIRVGRARPASCTVMSTTATRQTAGRGETPCDHPPPQSSCQLGPPLHWVQGGWGVYVDGALGLQLHMFERTQARGVCTSDQTPGSRLHPGPLVSAAAAQQHQLTLNLLSMQ